MLAWTSGYVFRRQSMEAVPENDFCVDERAIAARGAAYVFFFYMTMPVTLKARRWRCFPFCCTVKTALSH